MAKRINTHSTSGTANVIDMSTGKPAESQSIPIICANLRHYRLTAGIEQKELAARIGVATSAVSKWETGRGRPDLNYIPAICNALHINPYQLIGMQEPKMQLSEKEHTLINTYRKLTPGHQYSIDTMAKNLLEVQIAEKRRPQLHVLPYYEKPLAAGIGDPTEYEGKSEDLYLHDTPELRRADCVYRVNGDSMTPKFQDGDLVFVQRTTDVLNLRHGEIGAFIIGNEFYIKQYEEDGLHSLNTKYDVMRFDDELDSRSVYLLGRVLGLVEPAVIASRDEIHDYQLSYDVED